MTIKLSFSRRSTVLPPFFCISTSVILLQIFARTSAVPPPAVPPPPLPPPPLLPPPPFLAQSSPEVRDRYLQIVVGTDGNGTKTKAQIKAQLEEWADQSGVKDQFANFTATQQKMATEFHQQIAGNLSGKALELFNQFWEIRQNDELTRAAECARLRAVLDTVAGDMVLRHLVPMPQPSIEGPPPPQCLPPPPPPLRRGRGGRGHRHGKFDGREVDEESEIAAEGMPEP